MKTVFNLVMDFSGDTIAYRMEVDETFVDKDAFGKIRIEMVEMLTILTSVDDEKEKS